MPSLGPNILMFGDWRLGLVAVRRPASPARRLAATRSTRPRTVIVELGAGMAVPTIRIMSEDFMDRPGGTLIRINPREPDVPAGHLAIPMGALAALRAIDERLDNLV